MREDEFREQLRGALGEPPPMAPPAFGQGAARRPRVQQTAMGAIAVALAILLVVVLVGTRGGWIPRASVAPPVKPSPATAPTPSSASSFPCTLPVTVVAESRNAAPSSRFGFVNVPSGGYHPDPSAAPGAISYSGVLKRWLPTAATTISPDGTSYAYVKALPASSELHVVDVASNTDRAIWSSHDGIGVILWQPVGILASTVPLKGGVRFLWRIDPATGNVARAAESDDPTHLPFGLMAQYHQFSYMGTSPAGASVFRTGTRDPQSQGSVFVLEGGTVATIYSGRQGDSNDFDPSGVSFDAHGIWFSNYDDKWVWLWSRASGLQRFGVTGLPTMPGGLVSMYPEGPCVPGAVSGPAASPFAAPSPSPAPRIPNVDWSTLTTRPLILPALPADGTCPVSPQQSLSVTSGNGKGGPSYGFGDWPAFVSGQIQWFSAGSQGVIVLVSPEYTGPIVIRSKRLDGVGSLGMSGESTSVSLAGGTIGVPVTSSPPSWGTWYGVMTPTMPGCYGIQIDGNSWSSVAVIEVQKGPPPPG